MANQTSISLETQMEQDGHLTLTGLPFHAGEHLVVQIDAVTTNGDRLFPMRGQSYQYIDPFEPAMPSDEWEATR